MITLGAGELDAWLTAFFYPFFRIAALASTAPLLSHPSVPRQARVGLAILLTVLVAPLLPQIRPISPFSAPGLVLIAQQVIVGMALGFAMQVAFAAVELAGDVIGLQMGLSFAAFIDPQNSEQTPLIGGFFSLTLMLVFTAINGHLLLLGALIDSFRAFPMSVLGVMLAFSGVELALVTRDQTDRSSAAVMFVTAGACIGLGDIALGFVIGITLALVQSVAQRPNDSPPGQS